MRAIEGDDPAERKASLQRMLDAALTTELAGVEVSRAADAGDPAMRIDAYAREHGVDLVMMPTRGQGVLRTMLLGSVTAKVLHDAACAVWTAAHLDAGSAATVPNSILCAVDISERTVPVCQWAVALAVQAGAALRVVHAVAPVSDWTALDSERQLQEEVRQYAESSLKRLMDDAGLLLPLDVVVGNVGAAVAAHAREHHAGIVVAGRGAINEAFGRFRAHTFDIIQRSPCPVISV